MQNLAVFDWSVVNWKIFKIEKINYKPRNIWIATAILNKLDKMELISPKLTELGIENINSFRSKRSVVKNLNNNKIWRIKK